MSSNTHIDDNILFYNSVENKILSRYYAKTIILGDIINFSIFFSKK